MSEEQAVPAGSETLAFNPFDPAFRADPYPFYRRLQEEDPRHRTPLGFFTFSRHADCLAVLRDRRMSSDERHSTVHAELVAAREAAGEHAGVLEAMRPFLFLDPPDHTRLRGLVSKAFNQRVVEGLRPRVQVLADELLDAALASGRIELVADLAYPLPVQVISELLGVPADDHETFKGWSADLARGLDPEIVLPPDAIARRDQAAAAFVAYFQELIEARRRSPGDDLLSALIQAEDGGDVLSEQELLSTCILLLVAGHETTVNLIGNGMQALLRHPRELARLRADGSLVKGAVEEMLRYDPPVQLTGRVALEDVEVGDVVIHRGEFAMLLLAAANRDPEVFEEPDRFDVGRGDNRHISFGLGLHFCLGAPLARLEAQVVVETLLRRAPHLSLPEGVEARYKENLVLRGLESLPLSLEEATPVPS